MLTRLIRAPEGVAAALIGSAENESVRRDPLGSPMPAAKEVCALHELILGDERADATTRLDIYANAYFYRILGVLENDYPALAKRLGADLFRDVVTSYLLAYPPKHPSLRYAGLALPDFLAASEAADGVRSRASWAPDLAAFEWARVDVFDAADETILHSDSLSSLSPEDFGELELTLGSWSIVRAFDYPVDTLYEATLTPLKGEGDPSRKAPADPERESTSLIIWRKQERVVHRRLIEHEENALALASLGTSFGSLCELAEQSVGEEAAPALGARWLSQWLADELLVRS